MNLVTGATGLLGMHVMHELLSRNENVRALARSESDRSTVERVFQFYQAASAFDQIEWIEGDVLDIDSLLDAAKDCSTIYHSAAVVSYHKSDRRSMYQTNVTGTTNVVNTALELGNCRLCHVSSIAALGKAEQHKLLNETAEWKKSPQNTHYGISKHLSEMEVWRGVQEGLQATIVNPGIIIGPGDFYRSSGILFRKIHQGLSYYPLGGTGFVSAKDCATIMVDLIKNECFGQRYVLVAENKEMREVFASIAQSVGKAIPHKPATTAILHAARIVEWLKELTTGKQAVITRENVRNTSLSVAYDSSKIINQLHYSFEPIEQAIASTGQYFLNHH